MSFLACHMWSLGWALPSGAAWGSFWAMAFQSPHCHLLDQRPCFPSPADVAADGTAEASHLSVYHNFMHMDSDRYGSLITYVEADTTNKRSAIWAKLLNAIFAQGGVCSLISVLLWIYLIWHSSVCRSIDQRHQLMVFWRTAGVA